MDEHRYCSLRILTECTYCGSPMVVNGPVEEITCASCQKTTALSHRFWNAILLNLDQRTFPKKDGFKGSLTFGNEGATYKISLTRGTPKCQNCSRELTVDSSLDFSSTLRCFSCGHEHSVQDPPSWVYEAGSMKLIGCQTGHSADDSGLAAMEPIAMNCPSCSGAMKISQTLERVTHCTYCGGEFYIPDPVWNRLHPVRVAQDWYVRFSGTPKWYLAQQEKKARQQKEQQIKQEQYDQKRVRRKYQNRINNLEMKILAKQGSWKTGAGWGYFVAFMAGIFAIGFPIIFIAPLSRAVGSRLCDGEFVRKEIRGRKSTSIKFYCKKAKHLEPIDGRMMLAGPGLGVLLLCSLWTAFIPALVVRNRKKIKTLQDKVDTLKQSPPDGMGSEFSEQPSTGDGKGGSLFKMFTR